MLKKLTVILGAVLLLGIVGVVVVTHLPAFTVTVPEYRQPGQLVHLEQGWNEAQRLRFHHTAQGTRLLPYAWFMALEQPCFSLTGCEPLADERYLARFGFLSSKSDQELNPDGLPVGFALQKDFYDPITKKTYPVVGLTCAACHTGQLHYKEYAVRIEGAPAMIEVTQFQKAMGLAFVFTNYIPFRYGRFEAKVLGPGATAEQKAQLKQDVDGFLELARSEKTPTDERKIYVNQAGFARTDALARIGNQVFAVDMKLDDNYAVATAPVRFPQIWDASWLNWVQYNSSISAPIVRNIGESLGVRAMAALSGPTAGDFDNSVHVEGLWNLEELLSGSAPYEGLTSPKWPREFPPLDSKKVERGAALYKQHCAGCHLPPIDELVADLKSEKPVHWRTTGHGRPLLTVTDVKIEDIGTDPNEAMDFINRTADTGALKKGRASAAEGLDLVTGGIALRFFDRMNFPQEKRIAWNGYRDPTAERVRALPLYKARPLNGIWAVAPYLHNGSVPNLYLLLSPQAERPNSFWLGSRQFDPVKVGYDVSELKGAYLFDVTKPGNSNKGHEFKDGPLGRGVIGPTLSADDRWALIEYMKSI